MRLKDKVAFISGGARGMGASEGRIFAQEGAKVALGDLRERLAAVTLDPVAKRLLEALDRETSIRWEDLPEKADADWGEACRAAAILALANLCEASPTRIRLSEYGDKMLAKSA